ncbi:MAG: glycosyltransferase family 8 protein [Pseudomonadota bacterium]
MSSLKDEVVLAFGVDAAYAPHLGVVLASIVSNAPGIALHVLVLHAGLPESVRLQVQSCAPGARFSWIEVSDASVNSIQGAEHISTATYYRLMIPEIVPPEVRRVLYLDVDLVVVDDIRGLWCQDLHGKPIGAIVDPGIDANEFAKRMGLPARKNRYFNAGILIIDIQALGEQGMRPAIELLETRRNDCLHMDQDALNAMFWENWCSLDYAWNMQRVISMRHEGWPYFASEDDFDPNRRPKIIHYTTHIKPWHPDGYHRFAWKYFQYLKQTPFWSDISKAAELGVIKSLKRRIRTWLNWQTLNP